MTTQRLGNRAWKTIIASLWLVAGQGLQLRAADLTLPAAPVKQPAGTPYALAFEQAAQEFMVPVEVLMVMGYQASRWNQMPGVRSNVGGYGIMGLHENPEHGMYQLTEAAKLLKLPTEQLKQDAAANIRGAAALLRQIADKLDVGKSTRLNDWWPVICKFRNFSNPHAIRADLEDVGRFLRQGAKLSDPLGQPIHLKPCRVDFSKELSGLHAAVKEQKLERQRVAPQQVEGIATADYGPALWVPCASCNYSTRSSGVDTAVVHVMEGYYSSTINWCRNNCISASWHYAVRSSDGEVTQQVEEYLKAWHASCWNNRAVGVEFEGFYTSAAQASIWFTEAMHAGGGALFSHFCGKYGLAGEHRVNNTAGGIAGHGDLWNCNDHGDPGAYWDWPRFISYVNGATPPGSCCCPSLRNAAGGLNALLSPTVQSDAERAAYSLDIDGLHVVDGIQLNIAADLTIRRGGQLILKPAACITLGGNLNLYQGDGLVAQDEPFTLVLTGKRVVIFGDDDVELRDLVIRGTVRQMLKPGKVLRVRRLTVDGTLLLGPDNRLEVIESLSVSETGRLDPPPALRAEGGWSAGSRLPDQSQSEDHLP